MFRFAEFSLYEEILNAYSSLPQEFIKYSYLLVDFNYTHLVYMYIGV